MSLNTLTLSLLARRLGRGGQFHSCVSRSHLLLQRQRQGLSNDTSLLQLVGGADRGAMASSMMAVMTTVRSLSFTDILKNMEQKKKPRVAVQPSHSSSPSSSSSTSTSSSSNSASSSNRSSSGTVNVGGSAINNKPIKPLSGGSFGSSNSTNSSINSSSSSINNNLKHSFKPSTTPVPPNSSNSSSNNSSNNNNSSSNSSSGSLGQIPKQKIDLSTLRAIGSDVASAGPGQKASNQTKLSSLSSSSSSNLSAPTLAGSATSMRRGEPASYLKEMMALYNKAPANASSSSNNAAGINSNNSNPGDLSSSKPVDLASSKPLEKKESVKSKFQINERFDSGTSSDRIGAGGGGGMYRSDSYNSNSYNKDRNFASSNGYGSNSSRIAAASPAAAVSSSSSSLSGLTAAVAAALEPHKQPQQQQQSKSDDTTRSMGDGERRYKEHMEAMRQKASVDSHTYNRDNDGERRQRYNNNSNSGSEQGGGGSYAPRERRHSNFQSSSSSHSSFPSPIKNNMEMSLEDMRASLRGSANNNNNNNYNNNYNSNNNYNNSNESREMSHKKKNLKKKAAPVIKTISIPSDHVSVQRLADLLGMKLPMLKEKIDAIGESLPENYQDCLLDSDTAELIIMELGMNVNRLKGSGLSTAAERKLLANPDLLVPRSPIVCIMGHVDHGKTTLLDTLRKANVAASEAGGITQRLSAFIVQMAGKRVVFLDTPGHAAFSSMRVNGASATDVAVLVIAIEDGLQPQSIEAIQAAKKAGCSIIVALNKVDRISSTELPKLRSKVLSQLIQHDVLAEEMGGAVQVVDISGKTGLGVDKLIECLSMEADVLNLKTVEKGNVDAVVMDACYEKGRGIVTDIVVKDGTLSVGDFVVVGLVSGKVKSLIDSSGSIVKSVGPATPVRVIGLRELPVAGTEFMSVVSEEAAQSILLKRKRINDLKSQRELSNKADEGSNAEADAAIRSWVNVILKADSPGTLEALRSVVENKISQVSNVKVAVVEGSVGDVTKSDIEKAQVANKAHILGFNIKISDSETKNFAESRDIKFIRNNVIYRLEEELVTIMRQTLPKQKAVVKEGSATLLKTFPLSVGKTSDKSEAIVAGLKVNDGFLRTSGQHDYVYSIMRNGTLVAGDIKAKTLRRLKDEVHEVAQGNECGLVLEGFKDLLPSDEVICNRIEWHFGNLEYH